MMPSASSRIVGLMVLHTKAITLATEIPTLFELRAFRSKALMAITNSGLRAALGRLGLELVVEPEVEALVPEVQPWEPPEPPPEPVEPEA